MAYGHDSTAKPGREGDAWRKAKEQVRRRPASDICWLCGEKIDMTLDYQDPMAWTVDHVQSLANGGDPLALSNLMPAHRTCNLKKGKGQKVARKFKCSRSW